MDLWCEPVSGHAARVLLPCLEALLVLVEVLLGRFFVGLVYHFCNS